jgi:hypothetical protein
MANEEKLEKEQTTFEKLYNINLSDKTKEKIGLKYLSWAYAWAELKKAYPDAERIIYKRKVTTKSTKTITLDGGGTEVIETEYENEIPYFTDGKTCTVKVGVKIGDIEYIEELPVMDNKNRSIRVEAVTSVDVNRAIQRCFVKACALHGLGLYIYAGEDLPEADRVTVDFESLKQGAEIKETLTDEEFNEMRAAVIEIVKEASNWEASIGDQVFAYGAELFPNKRISLLENPGDAANLQQFYYFLSRLSGLVNKK